MDLGRERVNYQNIKEFDQASGTLKIIKGLPWLPGLPWKHEKMILFYD